MGIAKKTDGRYVVGIGVTDANDYKGSAAYRDIFIQLTESGASDKSLDYLNYLKDYAIYHNSLGEPIMPPSVNVWISNHGVTTAVEADDISLDGSNYTIGGIKWDGSAWDYTNAGQGSGGGGDDHIGVAEFYTIEDVPVGGDGYLVDGVVTVDMMLNGTQKVTAPVIKNTGSAVPYVFVLKVESPPASESISAYESPAPFSILNGYLSPCTDAEEGKMTVEKLTIDNIIPVGQGFRVLFDNITAVAIPAEITFRLYLSENQ